jgi:Sulfur oxidation protein SoxY/Phosphodiester glycosidase
MAARSGKKYVPACSATSLIASPADDLIELEAPTRAEDAAIVPVAIRTRFAQKADRYVGKVWLVINNNPSPIAAVFNFTLYSGQADVEMRVRVDEYTFHSLHLTGSDRRKERTLRTFVALAMAALTSLSASVSQGAPNHYPQVVPEVDANDSQDNRSLEKGHTRLRVSVSLNDSADDDDVTVGEVTVCSDTACYKPSSSRKKLSLYNTKNGRAEKVYEIALPKVEIKQIFFDEVDGPKVIVGDVTLASPVILDENKAAGSEVLIILNKTYEQNRIKYYPISSAIGYYHPSVTSVYYNPRFATTAGLKLGVKWSIPAGALSDPQVFIVSINNTGDPYPMVGIYPEIELSSSSILSAVPLKTPKGIFPAPDRKNQLAPKELPIKKTGVFVLSAYQSEETPQQEQQEGSMIMPEAATDVCVGRINADAATITSTMGSTGAVYYRKCETIAPFVHIVIGNNYDGRENLKLLYNIANPTPPDLTLRRIDTYVTKTQVVVNGFAWVGDQGTGPGTGRALGFVQNDATALGNNNVGGGVGGTRDGNKLAFLIQPQYGPRWKEGTIPPLWIIGQDGVKYPAINVSSSTSIKKGLVCSTDSLISRWSAFGTTPAGRVIFMSSTSTGKTSAAELCAVFRALGADFAIRLDGSSAAGMTVDGILRNPLQGIDLTLYGPSRYVAYGLGFTYNAWQYPPPPTPQIKFEPCDPRICSSMTSLSTTLNDKR